MVNISQTKIKSNTSTWRSWKSMKQRCYLKTMHSYKYYGGRGIKVCDRWLESFANFASDMGERPEGTTLDRIDSNGDYTPENCRWSDIHTQNTNRRIPIKRVNKYKGVYRVGYQYQAYIVFYKNRITIGYFNDEEYAASMYDQYLIALSGDDGITNFEYK